MGSNINKILILYFVPENQPTRDTPPPVRVVKKFVFNKNKYENKQWKGLPKNLEFDKL